MYGTPAETVRFFGVRCDVRALNPKIPIRGTLHDSIDLLQSPKPMHSMYGGRHPEVPDGFRRK